MSDPRPLNLPKADAKDGGGWIKDADGGAVKPKGAEGPRHFADSTPRLDLRGEREDSSIDARPMSFEAHVANNNAEREADILQDELVQKVIAEARAGDQQQIAALQAQVQQVQQQMLQLQAGFAEAAVETAAVQRAALAEAEGQMLDLAVAVAGAIIDQEVTDNPGLHRGLAQAALESLGDVSRATLRAAPEAYGHIVDALGGDEVELRGVRVRVLSDAELRGLGCVVETDAGRVDGRVSERLRVVRRAFEDEQRVKMGGGEAS